MFSYILLDKIYLLKEGVCFREKKSIQLHWLLPPHLRMEVWLAPLIMRKVVVRHRFHACWDSWPVKTKSVPLNSFFKMPHLLTLFVNNHMEHKIDMITKSRHFRE